MTDTEASPAVSTRPDPAVSGSTPTAGRSATLAGHWTSPVLVVGLASAVIGLYVLFVVRFAVNQPSIDDWSVVPLINAQLHGHLTLSALWAQHNDNRFLFPNLILVGLGLASHYDVRWGMYLGAALLVMAFGLLLLLHRNFISKPLSRQPWAVVVLGGLWFSLADWQNALWSFQLGWYLVLLLCVAMVAALLIPTYRWTWIVFAVSCAVVASYSSLQGLLLWPVGLICLLWRRPGRKALGGWLGGAAATTVLYFAGYHAAVFQPIDSSRSTVISSTYAFHHLLDTVRFFFVALGGVASSSYSANHHWLGGLVGALVFAAGIMVIVDTLRHRDVHACAPLALTAFGLLFEMAISLGRVQLGLDHAAFNNRYTMAPLLILTAVAMFVLRRPPSRTLIVVLCAALALQVGVSTTWGITRARIYRAELADESRLVVNQDSIPKSEASCYAFYETFLYGLPTGSNRYERTEARNDRLSVFSSSALVRHDQREGLPRFADCSKHR